MLNNNNHFRISEAAKYLGVSSKTLRRWGKSGKLVALRSSGNQRYYSQEQLSNYQLASNNFHSSNNETITNPQQISNYQLSIFNKLPIKKLAISLASVVVATLLIGTWKFTENWKLKIVNYSLKENTGVLAAATNALTANGFSLKVNAPALFEGKVNFADLVNFAKDIVAPNIIYSLTAGTGIGISSGQTPVVTNTGVTSLGGNSGSVSLAAGTGISVSGLTVGNSDAGSAQTIFKTIKVGSDSFSALTNTDILEFIASGEATITPDIINKKLTFSVPLFPTPDYTQSGWTKVGGVIGLTNPSDTVNIGSSSFTAGPITGTAGVFSSLDLSFGGITNAGTISGATGLTASGQIQFSSLGGIVGGIVHNDDSGLLSSRAVSLTDSDVSGVLPVGSGGTGLAGYTPGDLLYASGAANLKSLGIGSVPGQVLVVSAGLPAWGTITGGGSGGICTDCLVTDSSSTQVIFPTTATASGLIVRQATDGTADIFKITDSAGTGNFLTVDKSGNIIFGTGTISSISTGAFSVNPVGSDPISISPFQPTSASFTGTITSNTLTAPRTWTFPDLSGIICTTGGNCSGTPSSLGGSGTANHLAKWSGTYLLTDSILYDTGTFVGIGTITPSHTLEIVGTGNISGATGFGGTLGVAGGTTLLGALGVTGTGSFSGTLGVTDAVNFYSTVRITGNTTVDGILKVGGTGNSYFSGSLVGIGTTSPAALLSVGASSQFQVNANGEITKLNNLAYTSWPSTRGAGGFLQDTGPGALIWTTVLPAVTTISFDKIASGTNTVAAMVVGGGAILNYSGGTINASTLTGIGKTWEAPGTIGFTTPNTGAFTTLSANSVGNALTLSGAGTAINFSGAGLGKITTATNQNLAIMPAGTGNVGIGIVNPIEKLAVMGSVAAQVLAGVEGIKLTDTSDVTKLAMKWGTGNVTLDVPSASTVNKFTNGGFDTNITTGGWSGNSLLDQFTTSAPTTLVSGVSGLTNGGVITPGLGTSIVTNGDMETGNPPTGWPAFFGATLSGNADIRPGSAGIQSLDMIYGTNPNNSGRSFTTTAGNWYLASVWLKKVTYSTAFGVGTAQYDTSIFQTDYVGTDWANRTRSFRSPQTTLWATLSVGAAGEARIDDISVQPLTLSSLFSTVVETTANKIISAGVTLTPGTQAGLVINADATFANFIIAYHDGTKVYFEKNVGGTYSSIFTAVTATYVANATLKVIKLGNVYQVVYNNVLIGSGTVSDAGIVNNTIHGLFSTYSSNSFTNFLITTNLDGTQAEPTGGTRTVVDTESKLSITGGTLTYTQGTSSDIRLAYPIVTRGAGKVFLGTMTPNSEGELGWDNNTSGTINDSIVFSSSLYIRGTSGTVAVGTYANGVTYNTAIVQRATGTYYYLKGGAYTNWTLIFISSAGSADAYPAIISSNRHPFTADNIRIPTNLWLPVPLGFDTFTTDTGFTTTETSGPDAQTTPSLAWTQNAATWSVSGGKALNNPTIGGELTTNGNFETGNPPSGWTASGGTLASVGSGQSGYALQISNGSGTTGYGYQSITTVAGTLYKLTYYFQKGTSASGKVYVGTTSSNSDLLSETGMTNAAWTQYSLFFTATSTTTYIRFGTGSTTTGETALFDTVSVMPTTSSQLFASVSASTASVIADANIVLTTGTQAGLVLNLDSTSSPSSYRLVYIDGGNAYVEDVVSGVATVKQATAITYSAGATLRAISDGTSLRVYYNNALVGSALTMTANTSKNHGLFSTYSGNTFDNFTLWARGGGVANEYVNLPDVDLTASRDTTVKYAGSASLKLIAGTNDNAYTQPVTLPNTSTYNLSAYAYIDGTTPVTSAYASLFYDGNTAMTTTYTPAGNGWYKMSASFTGVTTAQNYGVLIKAGRTVYIDSLGLFTTSGAATTLNIANSTTGLGQLAVESTTTLNSGLASLQALIVKGYSGQTANLQEWQNYAGTVLAYIDSLGGASFARSTNSLTAYNFKNSAGTSVLDIDTINGNVGIGTTTPGAALAIVGTLAFTSSSNAGIYSLVPSALSLSTAGLERARIDASGNVGIGTTAPTNKLQVEGSIAADVAGGVQGLKISTAGVDEMALSYLTSGTASNGYINTLTSSSNNKFLNSNFDSNLTSWDYGNTLDDQFTTSAPTTLVSGGLANPTPTTGTELIDAWTNGTTNPYETLTTSGSTITSAINSSGAGTTYKNIGTGILGKWYTASIPLTLNSGTAPIFRTGKTETGNPSTDRFDYTLANGNNNFSWRMLLTDAGYFHLYMASGATNYSVASPSVKELTLSTLFSTVVETTANKIISTGVTLTPGTQAGIVVNADATFANFIIAYHDGTKVYFEKNVGGTYSSIFTAVTATYVADAKLKVIKLGNVYQVVYNNVLIGSGTVSDAGIVNNTIHGLFSTYSSNSFTNFLITTNLDGTQAEPTGGTRTVTDTGNNMSISSGVLNVASKASPAYGDPGLWYPAVTRNAGMIMMGKINQANQTGGTNYKIALIGFDTDKGSSPGSNALHLGAGTIYPRDSDVYGASLGSYAFSTDYQLATILRSTGAYYYIKGGTYTNWTLLWISTTNNTATLYPAITQYDGWFTADNIKIPTNLWLPTPLAYDTFSSAGSTATETSGPDAQTTPSLAWTGGTKAGGTMSITPTLGAEQHTSANAASDPNGNEANATTGWVASNAHIALSSNSSAPQTGTYNLRGTSDVAGWWYIYHNYTSATSGTWYSLNFYAKSPNTGTFGNVDNMTPTYSNGFGMTSAWANYIQTGRATSTSPTFHINTNGVGGIVEVDNYSLKPLTLSSLFSSVATSTKDVIADVNITSTAGTQAGIVTNLNSATTPTAGLVAYMVRSDGGSDATSKVYLDKFTTATTWTNIAGATGTVTYVAGATLRVITYHSNATTLNVRVYYNNALVGSEQTVTDSAIYDNTIHGLFSTYSGNTFDNFTLWARGSGGEYTDLPDTNLTVTNDTATTFGGTSASAKIIASGDGGAFSQSINVGDTNSYSLTAEIYTTGAAVTAADAELYVGSNTVATTYTSMGLGWYRMKATVTGVASARAYGVYVHAGKTVYIDNMALVASPTSNNFTNSNLDAGITGWNYGNTLEDQFTTSAPTTLVSGVSGLTNGGVITPGVGSDVLTNGNMEGGFTGGLANGWTLQGSPTTTQETTIVHTAGGSSQKIVAAATTGVYQYKQASLTAGNWVQVLAWVYRPSTSTDVVNLQIPINADTYSYTIPTDVWSQAIHTGRYSSGNTGVYLRGNSGSAAVGYLDDASVTPLTLSSLFSTVVESTANKIISTGVTLTPGTQAGIVVNADATFANFIIAYHDGTKVYFEKNVGGTYSSIFTAVTATYAPNATLKVIKLGNVYQVVYNNVLIGSGTVSDAGIVAGTKQGLFSTLSTNSFTNFLITTNLDGTQAEPTGGTRTVTDTNGKLSITGGQLSFATGAVAYGNPGLWYPSTARTAGKILLGKYNVATGRQMFGYDTNQSATMAANAIYSFGANSLNIYDNDTGGVGVGGITASTDYNLAIILRSTGAYTYVKGGTEYPNWTLLWISNLNNTSPLYPGMSESSGVASSGIFDNIKIPTNLWLPVPLGFDTFTTDTGFTTTETTGPDSQTTPSLAWTQTAGTWGVTGGVANASALSGSAFATVNSSSTDVLIDTVIPTYSAGVAGIVARYQNATNYLIAYYDGTNVKLDKVVGGSTTNLISHASGTYGAAYVLRLILDGTAARLYYNNVLMGTATVPTSTYTLHGLYTTNTGNTFDNFTVWSRSGYNVPDSDAAATAETTRTYGNSAGSVKVVTDNNCSVTANCGVNGATFTQSLTLPDTGSYTLSANVYTTGAAVTAADAELFAGTNTVPTTTFTALTGGWYKMSATITGMTSSQAYGVYVHASKTVYVDSLSLSETSNAAVSTLAVQNSLTGLGQMNVESTTTFNSGLAALQALIVKGYSGQVANLQEWDTLAGSLLARVAANGLVDATTGGLATFNKAGAGITDADFASPVNGLIAVDTTDNAVYVRSGGTWHTVGFSAGFQIPSEEAYSYNFDTKSFDTTQPLTAGDFLMPFTETQMEDGAVHGLYAKFSDVAGMLFASEEAQLASMSAALEKVSPLVQGRDLNNIPVLIANGAITFKTDTTFEGPAIFKTLTEFAGDVIIKPDAIFADRVTFDSDTAGFAVIPIGSSEVRITFDNPYNAAPVITTSPLWETDQATLDVMKELGTYVLPKQKYIVTDSTINGFTIILETPAGTDLKFSWKATSVENARTITGVVPTPSASPSAMPI